MSDCLSGLAEFIIFDLGQPSGLSNGQVTYWLENSVGNLNILLGTCYQMVGGCPQPPFDSSATGILTEMYKNKYYDWKVDTNLGASAYAVTEVREGDSVTRFVNRNELSKTYLLLSKDSKANLAELVKLYRTNAACPKSLVARVYGYYNYYYGIYGNAAGIPNVYRADITPECC